MKITERQFWEILANNGGIYSHTARAITKAFGVSYTRQAVRLRAERNPEKLAEIKAANIDEAESGLFALFRSNNEKVRLQAIIFYLKTQGKEKGYTERRELAANVDLETISDEQLALLIEKVTKDITTQIL